MLTQTSTACQTPPVAEPAGDRYHCPQLRPDDILLEQLALDFGGIPMPRMAAQPGALLKGARRVLSSPVRAACLLQDQERTYGEEIVGEHEVQPQEGRRDRIYRRGGGRVGGCLLVVGKVVQK